MYSLGISKNKFNIASPGKIQIKNNDAPAQTPAVQNPIKQQSFTSLQPPLSLRTELTTKEEKDKYVELIANLDSKEKKNLEFLLKSGILLNKDSNDKSSVLDNLYKIITTPRAVGLTPKVVLEETINTLTRPEAITQTFGDIPNSYVPAVLKAAQKNPNIADDEINENTINVEHSGACVSASIEFKLAKQSPAEFARFAEGLTSPKVSVEKTIQLKNLADNTLDTVWLLNAFEVPYEMNDFNTAKLTFAPDKNAILRAQIQNSNKDKWERSLVDTLMQSTFMNVGSQQAYDSLTDVRGGKFSQNNKGLIEFEKTFTESVVEDKNEISVTYQNIDENGKLVGYETDFNTIKRQLLDSLAMGEDVIIGYTQLDDTNTVINGHEITIIDAQQDKNGKLIFTCVDTDDGNPNVVKYPEDYLIPMIHHAGLPKEVAEKDIKLVDTWVDGVNAYQNAKKQPKSDNSAKAV